MFSVSEATLDAVLRALFSLPDADLREHLAALVRGYLTNSGRPNILDGLARTESAFAFATRKRQRFQNTWVTAVDDVVARRRNAAASVNHGDLLDLLLAARDSESGEALSDAEVRDQCGTMLAAGHETTARLLFWATYLLILDLAQQNRVHAEVVAFPPDRVTRLDDLINWPSVRQTLLEALRLYPPAAYITREAIADEPRSGNGSAPTPAALQPTPVVRDSVLPATYSPPSVAAMPTQRVALSERKLKPHSRRRSATRWHARNRA